MEAGESKCSGGGDGYTSSYSPSVTAGVLDVYTSAPASAAGMQCSSSDDTTTHSSYPAQILRQRGH